MILYVVLLEVFLVGVLFFFYAQSRGAILEAANRNVGLFVSQVKAKINLEEHELQQSARIIGNNVQLREYMFVVVNVGTETAPLKDLFQRQFGWLPYSKAVIISRKGRVLVGESEGQLLDELRSNRYPKKPGEHLFYYATNKGVEMAAFVPVYYQDRFLGNVVLTRIMDASLIEAARSVGYGHFFVVFEGKIIRSSLEEGLSGRAFTESGGQFRLGRDNYLVRKVSYTSEENLPQIWFAFSNPELTSQLDQNRSQMLALALGGSIAILLVGIAVIRNFSRPVGRLVDIMHQVGEGRFPDIEATQSKDEFGYLINQFQDMVTRLRGKQSEVDRVHSQLEEQATTDTLTGLYNRRYLYDLYPRLLSDAERQGKTITVILADLDKFKEINDHHGHDIGDKVLAHVSAIMRDCCRLSDFVFRIGGEEFLVLTTGGIAGGEILAEKIRNKIEHSTVIVGDLEISVTSSFGVAQLESTDGDAGLSAILARADKALYAAKGSGRNRVSAMDFSATRSHDQGR